jgi:hypothetical protein
MEENLKENPNNLSNIEEELFALHVKQDINVALMQEYIEKW